MNRWLGMAWLVVALVLPAAGPRAGMWAAGGLTFSDELGGFRLVSVSGSGLTSDPIIIVEEITGDGPAVLVVRTFRRQMRDDRVLPASHFMNLTVIKVVINSTGRRWAGFDLELQERLTIPSSYADGLSFDQPGRLTEEAFRSDSFAVHRKLDEPYDRVGFLDGSVAPGAAARFNFKITDPTPPPVFYLLQQPRRLVARRPTMGARLADLAIP